MSEQLKGTLYAFSGIFLMSFDAIFIRFSGLGGFEASFLFGVFSFVSMAAAAHFFGKGIFSSLKSGGFIIILSGAVMGGSGTTFVLAVQETTIANVVLIMTSSAVFSSVYSRILLGERTDLWTWAAVAASVIGVYIIVRGSMAHHGLKGDMLALAASMFSSMNYVIWRKYPQISRTMAIALGGFFVAIFSSFGTDFGGFGMVPVLIMAAMGLFSAPVGRAFISTAARHITAMEISLFTLSRTALVPFLAWLFFTEVPPVQTFVGGAVIFSVVALHSLSRIRRASAK
ncbi:DMT family transporter [Seleniivibrio woodruffii]|uniref:DMT family transporter n=1 Tax=Seleniivibrio woodruffii TaxID=1078050 RepID=UPI0026EDFF50|nr:DMT family transporter [Seleniivibrio woodruffii]